MYIGFTTNKKECIKKTMNISSRWQLKCSRSRAPVQTQHPAKVSGHTSCESGNIFSIYHLNSRQSPDQRVMWL